MMRVVATLMTAAPKMTTARMQNITIFAIFFVLPYFVLVLNLPIVSGAPPSSRLGREPLYSSLSR